MADNCAACDAAMPYGHTCMQSTQWTSPYRIACDDHNEHRPVFTRGRPLLDDSCPWCIIKTLSDENGLLKRSLIMLAKEE